MSEIKEYFNLIKEQPKKAAMELLSAIAIAAGMFGLIVFVFSS